MSAAIRLKQLAEKENREIRVLLLEKGSEMGSPLHSHSVEFDRRTYSFRGSDTDECIGRVISQLVGESSGTDYACKEGSNEVSDKGEFNSDSCPTTDA